MNYEIILSSIADNRIKTMYSNTTCGTEAEHMTQLYSQLSKNVTECNISINEYHILTCVKND